MAVSYYPPEMDAHLWRAYRSVEGQLKIGVVLQHTGKAPRWVAKLLYLLIAEPAVKLDVVYRLEGIAPTPKPAPSALFRLIQKDSERFTAPLAVVPMVVRPACCFIDVEWDESACRFTEESRETIEARQLDALVWLDAVPATGDCGGLARFGVWSFALGDPSRPTSEPPYWREIASEEPVSIIALLRHPERLECFQTIAMHAAPTVHGWRITENAEQPAMMAGPLLIRALLDALSGGRPWIDGLPKPESRLVQTVAAAPNTLEAARFVAKRLRHSLHVRARSTAQRHERWSIAVRPKQGASLDGKWNAEGFQFIKKPRGSEYADPFIIENGGRHFLFFEDVPAGSRKGRISVLEISGEGESGEQSVALEESHHLSYPFVFRHNDELFMVPESAASNTVPLYKARRFPNEWEHCANLVAGISVVDTTPFFYDSVWYIFATSREPGIETFLLYADRLDGQWQYHPVNPICSDARRARGAGAIFERNGRWLRPSQDCSVRCGYAIIFNEIVRLSTTEYEERPFETTPPGSHRGIKGARTYNSNDRFEVIDTLRSPSRSGRPKFKN
jgi:hypothetical protein